MSKKLYRSVRDKMLGGVAGGLAEYFDIDPTIVRVLFVISLLFGGAGVIAYIILWIIVPEEPIEVQYRKTYPPSEPKQEEQSSTEKNINDAEMAYQTARQAQRHKRNSFAGVILIVLGFIFLADNFIPRFHFGDYWPLLLVLIGIVLLINSKKD